MRQRPKEREALALLNPKKAWVRSETSQLVTEWEAWQVEVEQIEDQPYNKNTHSEVFADGEDMMERHNVLQAKTVTFLDNNIAGHAFIYGLDGTGTDRTDLRLHHRVKHRLSDLRRIEASLPYARGFWREKARRATEWFAGVVPGAVVRIIRNFGNPSAPPG